MSACASSSGSCSRRTPGRGNLRDVLSIALAPDSRRFTAVRAGHPGMLVHGRTRWSGSILRPAPRLVSAPEWPVNELELPEGHGLLLLTDGLFEGHSGRGNERLGEDGLLELARSVAACPAARLWTRSSTKRRRGHAAHGGHTDDIAVVRVERTTR